MVKVIQIQAQKKDISFHAEIAPDLPKAVRGDEKRLNQILLNLLSNAVKFTQEGSIVLRVVRCEAQGASEEPASRICFQTEDTGIGIPEDHLEDIFSPFRQVGDHSRFIEGTGLGLTISRKLVRLMGGDLSVKSTAGEGSVFSFEIELPEISEHTEMRISDDRHIIGYTVLNPHLIRERNVFKILVTDDRWENRAVLVRLLSSLGFEVFEADDGSEGFRKASEFEPDLIFMDLVMPVMDGFEATRQIRKSPKLRHMKIIAVSASSSRSSQQIISENDFDDFIPKPVEIQEIFKALETHLQLEWKYKKRSESVIKERDLKQDDDLVVPPLSELRMLYKLARGGDIIGIRKRLDIIEQSDRQYVLFVKEVRNLARTFQIKEIRELTKKHIGDEA